MNSRRYAFTLIELLVVLSIIALLVAILLPALEGARRTAQTIQCRSNFRQIGIAVQLYLGDNNNRYPAHHLFNGEPRDFGKSYPDAPLDSYWAHGFGRYFDLGFFDTPATPLAEVGGPSPYACPAVSEWPNRHRPMMTMNYYWSFAPAEVGRSPSGTMIIIEDDATVTVGSYRHYAVPSHGTPGSPPNGTILTAQSTRHKDGVNALFRDGSARFADDPIPAASDDPFWDKTYEGARPPWSWK